jgi:VHL beta domain
MTFDRSFGSRERGRVCFAFVWTLICCAACAAPPSPPIAPRLPVHAEVAGPQSGACPPAPVPANETRVPIHSEAIEPRADAFLELATVTCGAEPSLRSTSGDAPVLVRFVNLRAEPIELIWLDYDGKRKSYGTLNAGETREQRTFLTHPWLVANLQGVCLDIRIPRASGYQATIH